MKNRNVIFDNLRGICMLGVIAIHAGSFVMDSGTASVHIFMFMEILSRYSVPAFFFISGYGLFYTYSLEKPLAYWPFIKKRLTSIGVPYIIWSLFYLVAYDHTYHDIQNWHLQELGFTLAFGNAVYHIYFLVILMWFYLLFPLWRKLLSLMEKCTLKVSLPLLFLAQLYLYNLSSHFWGYPAWIMKSDFIYNLFQYRLNYFPFFYLFVFILGGIIARNYETFVSFLRKHFKLITLFFFLSASCNAAVFYRHLYKWHMDLETIVNTLQQLSTYGLVYTIASLFFFCALLDKYRDHKLAWLQKLSQRSFLIYLVHPLIMDQLYLQLQFLGIKFSSVPMQLFYLTVVAISYFAAVLIHKALKKINL